MNASILDKPPTKDTEPSIYAIVLVGKQNASCYLGLMIDHSFDGAIEAMYQRFKITIENTTILTYQKLTFYDLKMWTKQFEKTASSNVTIAGQTTLDDKMIRDSASSIKNTDEIPAGIDDFTNKTIKRIIDDKDHAYYNLVKKDLPATVQAYIEAHLL